MTSVTSSITTVALGVVTAITLASCGSSGGSSADTTRPVASAPSESVTVDTSFSGQGSGDLCSYAKELEQSGATSNLSVASKADFEKIKDIMKNVEAKAPDEIKADVQTYEKGFATLQALYEKYNYDATKIGAAAATDPDVQKALTAFNDPQFQSAATRLQAYFQQVCGIAPSSS